MLGNFNLNFLDCSTSSNVKQFLNITFQNILISIIDKPKRVTDTNATLINPILTKPFLIDGKRFIDIVKSDISVYFPIFSYQMSKV